ncbi:hypothetical protein C8J56DRAFT_295972 [Mycena floridula]|nr:hypothetical protein C8J56DRAFT_295972 [Mycena floridula]
MASKTALESQTSPIIEILPYISASLSSIIAVGRSLGGRLGIFSLLLLSPAIYLFSLLFYPIRIAIYALDLLLPVYSFVGVACIIGVLVGISGKRLSERLVHLAQG